MSSKQPIYDESGAGTPRQDMIIPSDEGDGDSNELDQPMIQKEYDYEDDGYYEEIDEEFETGNYYDDDDY
jgi:hypothetical protein